MALTVRVMGVVNVTPDSFFAEARTAATGEAVARGLELFDQGADVVDVGGESTRPGAQPVDPTEESSRVVPVVAALCAHGVVSVDTQKPEVARAAVAAGATIINDVSGTLAELAGELRVGYVAMHRQGESATMQDSPTYIDVVSEVGEYLEALARRARNAGVGELWLDPGIGFGKTIEHNLVLLAHLDSLVALATRYDAGVLIGTSRKWFLGTFGAEPLPVEERLEGSLATEAWAILYGASMVRVHDVACATQLRELATCPAEEVTA